jgi:hypothetical protein
MVTLVDNNTKRGRRGLNGAPGTQGLQGPQGPQGPTGPPGPSTYGGFLFSYHTQSQPLLATGTWQNLDFDSLPENFGWNHLNPNDFLCTSPGLYSVTVSLTFEGSAASEFAARAIITDTMMTATPVAGSHTRAKTTNTNFPANLTFQFLKFFNINDILNIQMAGTSTSLLLVSSDLVSPTDPTPNSCKITIVPIATNIG